MKKSGKLIVTIMMAVILALTLLVAGCGTEKVENKILTVTKTYGDDKKIEYKGAFTGELKDGKPHGNGVFKTQASNGEKFTYTGGFKNGMFDGEAILQYENGKRQEMSHKEGKVHGIVKTYYTNGKLASELEYKNGVAVNRYKKYYPNGQLEVEGDFTDGAMTGKQKQYYENGQIKFDGIAVNGEITQGTNYYKDGSIRHKGNFVDGKPVK